VRVFGQDTDSTELVWHRDREDRIVESIEDTDWLFQFDDRLPQQFSKKICIPAGVYHRVIKGTGDLVVKVIKL